MMAGEAVELGDDVDIFPVRLCVHVDLVKNNEARGRPVGGFDRLVFEKGQPLPVVKQENGRPHFGDLFKLSVIIENEDLLSFR